MHYLHLSAFYFHVALGSIALILFWIPIATKKGAKQHIKFGQWYSCCMYAISLLGMFMTLLFLSVLTFAYVTSFIGSVNRISHQK